MVRYLETKKDPESVLHWVFEMVLRWVFEKEKNLVIEKVRCLVLRWEVLRVNLLVSLKY